MSRLWWTLIVLTVIGPGQWGRAQVARIAIIPDTQNYVTSADAGVDGASNTNGASTADREMLLDEMVSAIIVWRPDFVIQVGDLTDSTGGLDSLNFEQPPSCRTAASRIADDPNAFALFDTWKEWDRINKHLFERLDAAGIPHIEVLGNHDSCVEFERWLPAATFMRKSWGYAVDQNPARQSLCGGNTTCGGGGPRADTTHRAGLFPTPIGPMCVIGVPFNDQDVDTSWAVAQIGCGAGRPTIFVEHGGVSGTLASAIASAPAATKNLVVAQAYGHYDSCLNGGAFLSQGGPGSSQPGFGSMLPVSVFSNWQEVYCGPSAAGQLHHTGLSWWTKWTLDPAVGSKVEANNPHLGGITTDPNTGPILNTTLGWGFNKNEWCARFGCTYLTDLDGDGFDNSDDNCPNITNPNQADSDGDGVGDACDNCVDRINPRIADPASYLRDNPWATFTGAQRDDDNDGYGNMCDSNFFSDNSQVTYNSIYDVLYSIGLDINFDTCGANGGIPCAAVDMDGNGVVYQGDLQEAQYRYNHSLASGPKCPTCPLACAAGTAGKCN